MCSKPTTRQVANYMALMYCREVACMAQAIGPFIIEAGAEITKVSIVLPQLDGKRSGISLEIEYTDLDVGSQSELYKHIAESISEAVRDAMADKELPKGFDVTGSTNVTANKASFLVGIERTHGSV